MSYLPTTDEALKRDIASRIAAGQLCAGCEDETFRTPLGTPTACVECWNKMGPKARALVVKANRNEQWSVIKSKPAKSRHPRKQP